MASYLELQSTCTNIRLASNTMTQLLFLFFRDPSGFVYSLPKLPTYRCSSFTAIHSHLNPLSVLPSPSIIMCRGTVYGVVES